MIIVGSIGAPYGVRGWVKINSFTEPKASLFTYPWQLENANSWQPVQVEEFKAHANGFVAKLANVVDRDQAALITNKKIAVERDELPELESGEHYWADLIGLDVYNHDDILLGKAVEIFATGANDVLVVQDGKKEHLIPLLMDSYVLDVDTKRIKVRWDPEF